MIKQGLKGKLAKIELMLDFKISAGLFTLLFSSSAVSATSAT